MLMTMFVLDDPELLDAVLDAWHDIGVTGATIVESSGLNRRRAQTVDMGSAPGWPRVVERNRNGHFTIFLIVRDCEEAERCRVAAEALTGDLTQPNTGVFAAWELALEKGAL